MIFCGLYGEVAARVQPSFSGYRLVKSLKSGDGPPKAARHLERTLTSYGFFCCCVICFVRYASFQKQQTLSCLVSSLFSAFWPCFARRWHPHCWRPLLACRPVHSTVPALLLFCSLYIYEFVWRILSDLGPLVHASLH